MSNNHFAGTHGRSRFLSTVKTTALCLAIGFSLCGSALAEGPEEDYFKIYDAIQQADALNPQTQAAGALAQYRAAQLALQNFRKTYPDWNVKVVAYRWAYLTDKIAALSAGS